MGDNELYLKKSYIANECQHFRTLFVGVLFGRILKELQPVKDGGGGVMSSI